MNEYAYFDFEGRFPRAKRNFIKENVKSIRHLQGAVQEAQPRKKPTRAAPPVVVVKKPPAEEPHRLTHRAVQTEREEDLAKLYDTGVVKYASPKCEPQTGQGDHRVDDLRESLQNFALNNKDFVEANKRVKGKAPKSHPKPGLPESYRRGEVPKYLRPPPRAEPDSECPAGHVQLPEDERKETLRVLRQSYADRIQELNLMPVRNDTLKMKKRKMEIEEELKRIDGGIKVFQRPKVYVKINA